MEVNNKINNVIKLKDLQLEILLIVKEFSGEINNLLNTTKIFAIFKKDLLQWNLNKEYSVRFIFNEKFYNKFMLKIITKKQVNLNLEKKNLDGLVEIISGVKGLDLNRITGINELILYSCGGTKKFIDAFLFKNITILNLSCSDIKNVSSLGNVHTLNLSSCNKIIASSRMFFFDKIQNNDDSKNILKIIFLNLRFNLTEEEKIVYKLLMKKYIGINIDYIKIYNDVKFHINSFMY